MTRRDGRDAPEFAEFATVMTPRLFRSALLLAADWHLAEDLVQTTLAKLYVAWGRVRRADNPEAYAHGTLVKTYLSHQRVRRNTEAPTRQGVLVDGSAPGPDPDVRLDLFAALATLSDRDRAVIVLRYWEDRSVAETAGQLGLTEATVRTAAARSKARLRAALSPTKEATP